MKTLFLAPLLCFCISAFSQYYYKDIIGTRETTGMMKAYKGANVSRVVLASYDGDNTRNEDFYVEQQFSAAAQTLRTITRSGVTDESSLTSYLDADGSVIKTVDSAGNNISTTLYTYSAAGQLTSVVSTTTDSARAFTETEEHLWEYSNGKITRLLRIKNKTDTFFVQFKWDERGNIIEERATRNGINTDPVYYYYDAQNRLTDIVRFNAKARRLLPEYLFEYSSANQVIQKITVPGNSSDYLIWRYQFDDRGLKTKEAVYNKQKQLRGKIEYQYQFAS